MASVTDRWMGHRRLLLLSASFSWTGPRLCLCCWSLLGCCEVIVVMWLLTLCGSAPADIEVEEWEHLVQFVCAQMFSAGVNVWIKFHSLRRTEIQEAHGQWGSIDLQTDAADVHLSHISSPVSLSGDLLFHEVHTSSTLRLAGYL